VLKRPVSLRSRYLAIIALVAFLLALAGCQGVSSASKQSTNNVGVGAGQLGVSPSTMNFGNVAVGSNATQTGTLTAGSSDITVTSADWNGSGYTLSGITFPVTVPATQSVQFKVKFAPQTAGSAPGSVAFHSDATNSPTVEILAGSGTQQSSHTVSLSWDSSTSQVIGYNVYRGTVSG